MAGERNDLGGRVAAFRKDRGMSQRDLAGELGRSESWVSQVERGVLPVDRVSVLQSLSTALGVSIGELQGVSEETEETEEAEYRNDLDGLRLAITGHPALDALFGGPLTEDATSMAELKTRVDEAWRLVHAAEYGPLSDALSALIPVLENRVRHEDSADECGLLARAYQVAATALARQDEPDAAWVAADRAIQAAERAKQPLEVVAGSFRLAHTFLRIQSPAQAERVASDAIRALHRWQESGTLSIEGRSLYGALHLVRAVISAREGDRQATHEWISKARSVAAEVGDDRNDFDTEFGPTNVEIHAVTTSVDLGDAGMALDLATHVDTSQLSPERRARFLMDQARAFTQRRQVGEAIDALLVGEELAPEQIRTHPLSRQTIRDLVQVSRRVPPSLAELAQRAAV